MLDTLRLILYIGRQIIIIDPRQKLSFKPNAGEDAMFRWNSQGNSKNYCGFVVDEFFKLVHTINLHLSDCQSQSQIDQMPGTESKLFTKFHRKSR